jgi:hypothetical protein
MMRRRFPNLRRLSMEARCARSEVPPRRWRAMARPKTYPLLLLHRPSKAVHVDEALPRPAQLVRRGNVHGCPPAATSRYTSTDQTGEGIVTAPSKTSSISERAPTPSGGRKNPLPSARRRSSLLSGKTKSL